MKTENFKQGDAVYSAAGVRMEYVAKVYDGPVVRVVVEHARGMDEPSASLCEPDIVREVFAVPPVEKYSAALKALHAQIRKAKMDLSSAQAEHRQFLGEARTRAAEREKIESLALIDDVIAGRITHFAIVPNYTHQPIQLLPFKEAIEHKGEYGRKEIRLLSLYGDPEGKRYNWSIHQYRNQDSNGEIAYPCTSEAMATEFIQKHIAAKLAELERAPDCYSKSWAERAEKWGVQIPKKVAAKVAEIDSEARSRAIKSAQESHTKAVAEMQKLGLEVSP